MAPVGIPDLATHFGDYRTRIEQVLARHARKHVGVAVGARAPGETLVLGRGRIADDRPYPPAADTIFEIGSITKVFTATLLAQMAGEGLVGLHDPVQRYLPDGVRLPVRGRPITLADLAAHTSGLPRLPRGLRRRSLKQTSNPYAGFTVADLERAAAATKPRRAPGKVRYSDYGFGLLGHVLSLRTGRDYAELIAERICEPLGLTDTTLAVPDVNAARFARGHDRRGRRPRTGTCRRCPARAPCARACATCSSSWPSSPRRRPDRSPTRFA